jgi:hypothetical protein
VHPFYSLAGDGAARSDCAQLMMMVAAQGLYSRWRRQRFERVSTGRFGITFVIYATLVINALSSMVKPILPNILK